MLTITNQQNNYKLMKSTSSILDHVKWKTKIFHGLFIHVLLTVQSKRKETCLIFYTKDFPTF